jgi:hypothetical protein
MDFTNSHAASLNERNNVMTEMLDRITKALRTYSYMRLDSAWGIYLTGGDFIAREMSAADAHAKCDRLNAIEALKAMRDPTDYMIEVGENAALGIASGRTVANRAWRAMIDVAIYPPAQDAAE